jgi:hypothetical protein
MKIVEAHPISALQKKMKKDDDALETFKKKMIQACNKMKQVYF